ncbi:hypothetical protein RYA05_04640 [Pseudomonas syringae pv. actinidiae]|nr:hypothetical protein [Pseudomonas syringae pv. actinidiae]
MVSDISQGVLQVLNACLALCNIQAVLFFASGASIVILLLALWSRQKTSQIRGHSMAPSKEERAKGFDMVDIKNPRNFKILFDIHTPKEKETAKKWREKAEFMIGKQATEDMVNQALYERYGREEHSLCADSPNS